MQQPFKVKGEPWQQTSSSSFGGVGISKILVAGTSLETNKKLCSNSRYHISRACCSSHVLKQSCPKDAREVRQIGMIAGVAAPEASSHSKTQVDFAPTMSLGIPGDAAAS